MKKTFLVLLWMYALSGNAQHYRNSESYYAVTFTAGIHPSLFQHSGTSSMQFLYMESDLITHVVQKKQADISKEYYKESSQLEVGLLGLEGNYQRSYWELKTGLITSNQGGSMYGAIGGGIRKELIPGRFYMRLGTSLFYTGVCNTMGHLDNYKKQLTIFGEQYKENYTNSGSQKDYSSTTYDTYSLRIRQNYNCFGLKPKIGFEIPVNERKSRCLRLNIGYNIVLYDFTNIRFTQQAESNSSGPTHSYRSTQERLQYHFSNPSAKSPFGVGGFFVNLEFVIKTANIPAARHRK